MKDLINEKVKHRQWFRPFAPSILRERVVDWFEKDVCSPYMSFVIKFKEAVRERVPAVVHFDGTARLQTVTEEDNNWYYNFLLKWEEKTGVPIILNTSFNDREPIVETPEDAINCFLGTDIDYLYFVDEKILVFKK
jgi:carbamoyltransferase